ncbi:MAG: OB-fold domain-containing protein [Thermodesulfobacteriota bacteirum]|jgi:uncharacterized OB-fold protein|nr:OB-fold domain-containing protein [Thermodesulfobacteriota bacterium]
MSDNDERRVLHAEFFTEDPEPRLIAGKSKSSGNWTFPPYLADPVSFTDDVEHTQLPRNGVLHSFTIVRRSLPDFTVPFGLGLIDFPDQKVRVMAQVEADDLENDLELGMEVETIIGVVRKAKDGSDIYSYKFRPAK